MKFAIRVAVGSVIAIAYYATHDFGASFIDTCALSILVVAASHAAVIALQWVRPAETKPAFVAFGAVVLLAGAALAFLLVHGPRCRP